MTKTGYNFRGWLDDDSDIFYKEGQTFIITDDVELTAVWESTSAGSGCYEWEGTPSAFTEGDMTVSSNLLLHAGGAKVTIESPQQIYNGTDATVIKIGGDQQYLEGHIDGDEEITGITIYASNAKGTAGTDQDYLVLFCSSSAFSTGVTAAKYTTPSYKDDYNASKLKNEIDIPSGTTYFRVYRKLNSEVLAVLIVTSM